MKAVSVRGEGEVMSRYIDADALKQQVESPYTEYPIMIQIRRTLKDFIDDAPSIDIVFCKECKHRTYCYGDVLWTNKRQTVDIHKDIDFCSYGERSSE